MKTKGILQDFVREKTSSLTNYPDIVQKGMDTIGGDIPFKLKLAITLSELITFSSHLRKSIKLFDGTLVPTNAIVFALSASGTSKDKSLQAVRKSLSTAYSHLEEDRRDFAKTKAEKQAILHGNGKHEWQQFYVAPKPLQSGLGTVEGLMHHFSDISQCPIGAGSITSSEIGAELQANGVMVDIIKTVAVAYDLGNIPPKIVKSAENQTQAVHNFPVNALFFGSQEAILFNNEIKNKFKLVFNTQLARRSIFAFTPEVPAQREISSIDELYKMREKERQRVLVAQEALNEFTAELVKETSKEPLELSEDAMKLFDVYLELNSILSDELSNKFPISKLSRKHKQWLALKLAGSYAILSGDEVITQDSYAYAINTVELLSEDLSNFERELVKEPYEQLADMCRFKAENGEFVLSLHELRKLSYVTGAGSSKSKLEELATLANSYDHTGAYTASVNGINYKEIVKTDRVTVSFLSFPDDLGDNPKEFMQNNCAEGFETYETDFSEIELLLKENAAYSPFKFIDGKRGKSNIAGNAKFIVFDVDKSLLTDEEAHLLLEGYNHYLVRTSDPENAFKFRVLIELDSPVDIENDQWKHFIAVAADELGLEVDLLPKSQIYFAYSGREVLKQLDGKTLETKFLLEKASRRAANKTTPPSKLSTKEKSNKLSDPLETFHYAFNAENGEGSNLMYRALAHAIDLGADGEYVRNLANEINDYWMDSLDPERLEITLIQPALRRL